MGVQVVHDQDDLLSIRPVPAPLKDEANATASPAPEFGRSSKRKARVHAPLRDWPGLAQIEPCGDLTGGSQAPGERHSGRPISSAPVYRSR